MKTEEIALLLREYQLKATPQRLKIVESLNRFGHLNIDMMYSEVKKSHPNVSLATVYKNVTIMTQNGLLEEVKIPEYKSVFEIKKMPHIHLQCRRCGEILDIEIPIETLERQAEEQSGYAVEKTDIVMRGICPHCRG